MILSANQKFTIFVADHDLIHIVDVSMENLDYAPLHIPHPHQAMSPQQYSVNRDYIGPHPSLQALAKVAPPRWTARLRTGSVEPFI